MTKILRTSNDYTIKAGDGFNSGAGTNTITLDSSLVSVAGNLTVAGTTTTVNTTNTVVADNIIELNSGISSSNNDAGIIIERGSTGDNAAIVWDESADSFVLGTTTATGADKSGGISVTAGSLTIGNLITADITANSLTTNVISSNGSNAGISIQPSGSGEVLLGSLRLNGTTLDTDDSSAITIGEEINFQGAVNLLGGDLITGGNRISFNDQSSGTVSFLDFTVTQFGQSNNTVLSSVKSINMFLDSNGGDTGEAFRIYNNTNPDSSPTENTYIFKVDESGDLFVTGDTTMTGDLTATDITANSLTTNVISANGSNAGMSIQPSGTGNLTLGAVKINGTTLSSDDSTKITIAEATDVTGTLFSRGNVFGVQRLTGSGSTEVVSLTDTVTLLITTGSNQAFSLADGVEGQLKIISMVTDGGDGIVTPANFINGTQITFNDVEDTVVLLYQSTGWVCLARQNAIFS
tara:strand:- start:820 stop:2214 length:1395 start_codon:yes stop_codon:yes gene_type:complete